MDINGPEKPYKDTKIDKNVKIFESNVKILQHPFFDEALIGLSCKTVTCQRTPQWIKDNTRPSKASKTGITLKPGSKQLWIHVAKEN